MILKRIIIDKTLELSSAVSEALTRSGFPFAVSKTPILDSLGTVALSDWNLHPVIRYTERQASQNRRPFLHVDINGIPICDASSKINRFIETHKTRYLYVIAAASEKSPIFAERIGYILDSVILMGQAGENAGEFESSGTAAALVEAVLAGMSLREKSEIANLGEDALRLLQLHVDQFMEKRSDGIMQGADRREIMRRVWLCLRETHRLRVVE